MCSYLLRRESYSTVALLLKINLRRKSDCTCNLKELDGQKERTVLQEVDSHLKKKLVSRTFMGWCAKTGTGWLGPLDSMQTLPGPGETWMGSSETGWYSLCNCVFYRCIFQVWKLLQQVITAKENILTCSLSSSCKTEFKQKTSKCETSLILGVRPSVGKAEIRTVHRKIMISN